VTGQQKDSPAYTGMRRDNFVNGFFLDFILFLFAFWLDEKEVRKGDEGEGGTDLR
jgi:hypothetical protein